MLAIYFDLDGTLLDSSQCSVITAQDTFKKFCDMDIDPQRIIAKMGIPIEISFRELSDNKINDDNWEDVASYFREKYKANSEIYTSLFEGIPEFLQAINGNTVQMFIVTSKKSTAAEHNLSSLNIRHYFEEVIGSDKVAHYKPHPDPIYQARKFLKSPASAEIVIGDADTDIIMGRAAEIITCAVTWGAHDEQRLREAKPSYIINTIKEMQNLILSL
jgi:phosphoglycolate phosphatase